MKLVKASDPILHTPPKRFDFTNPPIDPEQLADDLKEAMIKFRGIGLSANQVGIPYQVLAAGDYNDPDNIVVCFNPRIVFASDHTIPIEEGCLSYPGIFLIIERPSVIRLRCANFTGRVDTQIYDGVPARIVQHEMDHMMGTNFTAHVSKLKLDRAKAHKKKLDKMRKINLQRISSYG